MVCWGHAPHRAPILARALARPRRGALDVPFGDDAGSLLAIVRAAADDCANCAALSAGVDPARRQPARPRLGARAVDRLSACAGEIH